MNLTKNDIHYLTNKYIVDGLMLKVPLSGAFIEKYRKYKHAYTSCGYEPGHFYSPIPSQADIQADASRIFGQTEVQCVSMNLEAQRALLDRFRVVHAEFPYDLLGGRENSKHLYRWINGSQYRYSDVVFLYHVMRYLRPKRIIEVGSGFSSAAILDFNELFFGSRIQTTFIEPYPRRLFNLIGERQRAGCTVITEKVQNVPIETFRVLEENDILLIDSSHVVKIGSDVNHIIFNILPALNKGVVIHFHDIFYPFELPRNWLKLKRFWNESYLLRAFLMCNDSYEVFLFNTLLQQRYRSWFEEEMPECLMDEENCGALWIRKAKEGVA